MQHKIQNSPAAPHRMLRDAWFSLTPREQRAVAVVLALFLLGLTVRYTRLRITAHSALLDAPPARQTLSEDNG